MKKLIALILILFSVVAYAAATFDELAAAVKLKNYTYNGSVAEHVGKQGVLIKFGDPIITPAHCILVFPGDAETKITLNAGADGWVSGTTLAATMNIPFDEIKGACGFVQTIAYGTSPQGLYYDSVNDIFMSGVVGQTCTDPVAGWPAGWYTLESDPQIYAYCE